MQVIAIFNIEDGSEPIQATLDYDIYGHKQAAECFQVKEIPKKMKIKFNGDYQKGVMYGWNGCIDSITAPKL